MSDTHIGRRFASTALVLFVGTLLSKLATIVLLPIYTHLLSPAEYGTYDLWFTICAFLGPILFFQVWDGVYRFSFDGGGLRPMVTNGVAVMVYGLLLYTVAMTSVLVIYDVPSSFSIYLFGASTAIQYFVGYLARCELQNGLLMWTGVVNTLVGAASSVGLLLVGDLRVDALFLGLSMGNVVQAAAIGVRLRAHRYFDVRHLAHSTQLSLLRFSLPLCVASAAYWMLSGFTRLALVWFDGPAANGVYAVADRFAFGMALVSTVVMYAWQEFLYLHEQQGGSNDARDKGLRLILRGVALTAAATLIAVNLGFDVLVGARFEASYVLVPLTVGAASLNTLANTTGSLFMAARSTHHLLTTTGLAAGVNVGLTLLLVPMVGVVGAGIALASAFAVLAIIRLSIVARSHGVAWRDKQIALACGLLGGSVLAFYWGGWIVNFGVGAAVLVAGALMARDLMRRPIAEST